MERKNGRYQKGAKNIHNKSLQVIKQYVVSKEGEGCNENHHFSGKENECGYGQYFI